MSNPLCPECARAEIEHASKCRELCVNADSRGEKYVCTCPPIVCTHQRRAMPKVASRPSISMPTITCVATSFDDFRKALLGVEPPPRQSALARVRTALLTHIIRRTKRTSPSGGDVKL